MLGKLRNINLRAKVSKYEVSDKQPAASLSDLPQGTPVMTPAAAAAKSPPAHLYATSDLDICSVCASASAKYRCPSCFTNYCSSGCYANHSNECTEGFSKARVKGVFDLEKNVKRYDANRSDVTDNSKTTKCGNVLSNDDDEKDDDDEEDDEEEGDLAELVEMLSSSNFDIEALTPEQQRAVNEKVVSSSGARKLLNGMIRKNMSLYRPFWHGPTSSSSSSNNNNNSGGITEIASGDSDIVGGRDMLRSVSAVRAAFSKCIGHRQSKLTVVRTIRLSENLSYQLALVLLAYAMIKKRTNGDLMDEPDMCVEFLMNISLNNQRYGAPPFQPPNLSEMLIGFMANATKCDRRIERRALKSLLRDDLLRLLSSSNYAVYCLLECWIVCCSVLQLYPAEEAEAGGRGGAEEEGSVTFQEQLLMELRSAEQMNNIFDRHYGGKTETLVTLLDSYYDVFSKPKVVGAHAATGIDAASYSVLDSFCRKLYFLLLSVLTEGIETERDVRRLHIFLTEYIDTYLQDVE